jgi:hypothetical protein
MGALPTTTATAGGGRVSTGDEEEHGEPHTRDCHASTLQIADESHVKS